MTVFDLLFIVLFLAAVITLIAAVWTAVRGHPAHGLRILARLAFSAALYIGMVYAATALSKPRVLQVGEPQCFDDWCFDVEHVDRTVASAMAHYDIALRLFSRARRVSQRENGARGVYLVDTQWNRYNSAPAGSEPPLNILLRPGESVTTRRTFELPANARGVHLALDHGQGVLPICLIVGECNAFHKGTTIALQ